MEYKLYCIILRRVYVDRRGLPRFVYLINEWYFKNKNFNCDTKFVSFKGIIFKSISKFPKLINNLKLTSMNIFFLHSHIAIFLVSFLGACRIRQLIKVIKTQFFPIRQFLNFQHSGRRLRANRMLLNRRIYTVGFYFSWEIIKTNLTKP